MSLQAFQRKRQSSQQGFKVDIQFPDLPQVAEGKQRAAIERWYNALKTVIQDAVDDLANEIEKKVTKA